MLHRVAGRKLNRSTKQRKALFKNLANSMILYEKIETTEAKAKAVRPFIEKLITISKENSVNNRRTLKARLGLKNSVDKLLEIVGPAFKERPGGYLRMTRVSPRFGDAARMVVIEFVEEVSKPKKEKVKNKEQATIKTEVKTKEEKPALSSEVKEKKAEKKVKSKVKAKPKSSAKVKNGKESKSK